MFGGARMETSYTLDINPKFTSFFFNFLKENEMESDDADGCHSNSSAAVAVTGNQATSNVAQFDFHQRETINNQIK